MDLCSKGCFLPFSLCNYAQIVELKGLPGTHQTNPIALGNLCHSYGKSGKHNAALYDPPVLQPLYWKSCSLAALNQVGMGQ